MRKIFFVLLLVLVMAHPAAAGSEITSVRFVSESWEDVTNADGTGLCWELFRMVYEPSGIQVEFRIVPYARATRMVQDKQADASVGVYLNEYEGALFSKQYYLQDIVLVIFKKGKLKNWEGEKSLSGKVAWMRGYGFNEYLNTDVEFYETDDRKSGLKMLEHGRIDFFLDTEAELQGALNEGYINPDDFQVEVILKLSVHLAFAENERGELKPLYKRWKQTYPFTFYCDSSDIFLK